MTRLVVLGGGMGGLVISKLLSDKFDEILMIEKDDEIYGLCRTKLYSVNGFPNVPVDIHGGHIFNSRNQKVLDFIFSYLPETQWNQLERNAKIYTEGRIIGWPFEYNLFEFGQEFMEKCLNEMQANQYQKIDTSNMRQYILTQYGKTACDKYFTPYNEKIWEKKLETIGTQWIQPHKMPVMDIDGIRVRNTPGAKDTGMTHSKFFYPKVGGFQQILERIRDSIPNLLVKRSQENYCITEINGKNHLKFQSGYLPADMIISTIPVNELRAKLGLPKLEWLQYHGTDFIVAESDFFTKHPDISWCYFPDRGMRFHRIANLAYLQQSNHPIVLLEAPYKRFRQADLKNKIKAENPHLSGYKFHTLEVIRRQYSYPIEPVGHQEELRSEIAVLENSGIYSAGRWGCHQYWNTDLTIEQAMSLAERIIND